jgi:hypothetical protein
MIRLAWAVLACLASANVAAAAPFTYHLLGTITALDDSDGRFGVAVGERVAIDITVDTAYGGGPGTHASFSTQNWIGPGPLIGVKVGHITGGAGGYQEFNIYNNHPGLDGELFDGWQVQTTGPMSSLIEIDFRSDDLDTTINTALGGPFDATQLDLGYFFYSLRAPGAPPHVTARIDGVQDVDVSASEPTTLAVLGTVLFGLAVLRRRGRHA